MFINRGKSKKEEKDPITWRGHEITRIEAFSDAVFAFAVTLLIVSLEVPKTYHELEEIMKGFFPFAISFTLFFQIWSAQNLFFRRFNLHDDTTLMLNGMLLFCVLFFVYPLKFLWNALFHYSTAFTSDWDIVHLMLIYGGGFATIYFLLGLMYRHACRKTEHIKLSHQEAFEARTYMYRHFGIASVAVLSIIIASGGPKYASFSGIVYCLIGPVVGLTHSRRSKVHRKKFGDAPVETTDSDAPHH